MCLQQQALYDWLRCCDLVTATADFAHAVNMSWRTEFCLVLRARMSVQGLGMCLSFVCRECELHQRVPTCVEC